MATGKIARLPREIREQVNRRLEDGEPGNRLVAWLNELPAVRALLAAEFGGGVIKEQNLTNWKQGGYRDWRMRQEVAALGVGSAEGEETFNAQHATLNIQGDGKFDGQQDGAEGRPTPVTAEQLATVVAVRYLVLIREWMQSPMPAERRWRQLRVILRDVLELQRGEHREQRLALDWERLEFARERFEEGKLADERRAMIGFLVAARQWPEVQEALASAFRLFQERKGAETEEDKAEFGAIKVNQGDKNLKNEEEQTGLVDGPPTWKNSPPQSACGAGKVCRSATDSTRYGLTAMVGRQESVTLTPRRSTETPLRTNLPRSEPDWQVPGVRTDGNLAKLKRIKVNQGDKFLKKEMVQDQFVDCPPRWRVASHKVPAAQAKSVAARQTPPATGGKNDPVHLEGQRGLWELMGHNGSEIFGPGRDWARPLVNQVAAPGCHLAAGGFQGGCERHKLTLRGGVALRPRHPPPLILFHPTPFYDSISHLFCDESHP